jgi:hypothetical protein
VLLTIGLSFGSYWKSLPPAEFLDWFNANAMRVPRPIPFVLIPTIIGMLGSFWLDRHLPITRLLWLGSAAMLAAVLIVTAAYFASENQAFASKALAVEEVPNVLKAWLAIHWLRIALATLAAAFAFVASQR